MPKNVIQQLASLLYAFSANFNDSYVKLKNGSGSVSGQKDLRIYRQLYGLELNSDDEGALNKLAYRVGSVRRSPVKKFLYNTKLSSLQITSVENQPLLLNESESTGHEEADVVELVYKGRLQLSWIETDYYFYMSPGSIDSGTPKKSHIQVDELRLKFRPDGQYQLLDCHNANDPNENERTLCLELSGVLDQPVNGMFKYINLTAKSLMPRNEWGDTIRLPLNSVDMIIG